MSKRAAPSSDSTATKRQKTTNRTLVLQDSYSTLVKNLTAVRGLKGKIATKYKAHTGAAFDPGIVACYDALNCIVEKLKTIVKAKAPALGAVEIIHKQKEIALAIESCIDKLEAHAADYEIEKMCAGPLFDKDDWTIIGAFLDGISKLEQAIDDEERKLEATNELDDALDGATVGFSLNTLSVIGIQSFISAIGSVLNFARSTGMWAYRGYNTYSNILEAIEQSGSFSTSEMTHEQLQLIDQMQLRFNNMIEYGGGDEYGIRDADRSSIVYIINPTDRTITQVNDAMYGYATIPCEDQFLERLLCTSEQCNTGIALVCRNINGKNKTNHI